MTNVVFIKSIVWLVLNQLILGNHLNEDVETIDEELEQQNFVAAGRILVDVWCSLIIDRYYVYVEYVEPMDRQIKETAFTDWDEQWAAVHIKFGHIHLSIMKCKDTSCYGNVRSNIHDVLQATTYPAPRWYTSNNEVLSLGPLFSHPSDNVHLANLNTILSHSRHTADIACTYLWRYPQIKQLSIGLYGSWCSRGVVAGPMQNQYYQPLFILFCVDWLFKFVSLDLVI